MIRLKFNGNVGYGSLYLGMAENIEYKLPKDDFSIIEIETRMIPSIMSLIENFGSFNPRTREITKNMRYAVHKSGNAVSYITLNEAICEHFFDYHLITIGKKEGETLQQHKRMQELLERFPDVIKSLGNDRRTRCILEQMLKKREI